MARTEEFNNAGYQKVLTYEVPGGGFSLYGHAPASIHLTAYGLLMLTDMSRVRFVDPALIERTQKWLISQQANDGLWPGGLRTIAHVVWALADSGYTGAEMEVATQYFANSWQSANDAYTLAVIANALVALNRTSALTRSVLENLVKIAQVEATPQSGKIAFWSPGQPTSVGARRVQADIETTGLAAYALLRAGASAGVASPYHSLVYQALTYLTLQKAAPHELEEPAPASLIIARVLRNLANAFYHNDQEDKTRFILGLLHDLENVEHA